ncbi:MAG: Yip1 family protein [Gemmatimonas sp.]|nr:Yip1 family protein [Gemmatimonadaceae bacterium]
MALVDRVKNILLSPRTEWPVIDAEPATIGSLYTGYIMPLAAIPVICQALGMSLFGVTIPFVGTHYSTPIGRALASAAVLYIFSLVAVFIVALIVDGLAPTFGGTKNQVQALKVVAYSYTASWVGGIFSLFPAIGIIGVLFGLYSLYLLFLGLPVLMKSPPDKAVGYTVVVVICAIIVTWVIFFCVAALGFGMGAGAMAAAGANYHP